MTTDSEVEYEEYEWAGQRRIRVCTMVEGGFPARILGDSTMISTSSSSSASASSPGTTAVDENVEVDVDGDDDVQTYGHIQYTERDVVRATKRARTSTSACGANGSEDEVTEKQEETPVRCLICLDGYVRPVVSIACWHTHCEQCWLRTLGEKKLCPQCKAITTPADLRRIYL